MAACVVLVVDVAIILFQQLCSGSVQVGGSLEAMVLHGQFRIREENVSLLSFLCLEKVQLPDFSICDTRLDLILLDPALAVTVFLPI